MANEYAVNQADLKAVADAIRTKGGTSDALEFPGGFVDAVGAIQAGSGGSGNQIDDIIAGNQIDVVSDAGSCADYAFYYNRYIKSISLPNAADIGEGAFSTCTSLVSVSTPNALKLGMRACWNSGKLEICEAPLITEIGAQAFAACTALKDIPGKEHVETLQDSAFTTCTSLTGKLSFPSVLKVGAFTFQKCSGITALEFGPNHYNYNNLAGIRTMVFDSCTQLETVILRATTLLSMQSVNAFNNTPIASGAGYIYVPSALVDSYKAATNWTTYADQIRAIEDYPEITGG